MLCNRIDLCSVLGVTGNTVDRYVEDGMPFEERPDASRGREWKFDTAKCIDWLIAKKVAKAVGDSGMESFDAAKRRERVAMATQRELAVAEKLKVLVNVDDVAASDEEIYAVVKSRLIAIPGRMAQPLSIVADPEEIERVLKGEIADALEEIYKHEDARGHDGTDLLEREVHRE